MNPKYNNEAERRYIPMPVAVEIRKSDEGESRVVSGYAAVFNELSQNLGWFREKIEPGAFDNVLKNDVVALFNHDMNHVLARNGKTLSLSVDEKGLRYEFEAPNTTSGNDLIEMLRRGDVQHSSFAFSIQDEKWEQDDEQGEIRTVLKVKRLYDVSPVVMPAYKQTDVSLAKRSYDQWKADQEPKFDDTKVLEQELELLSIL